MPRSLRFILSGMRKIEAIFAGLAKSAAPSVQTPPKGIPVRVASRRTPSPVKSRRQF